MIRIFAWLAAVLLVPLAGPAHAQDRATGVLTLERAVALTLERSAELAAARKEHDAAAAGVTQAGVLPNPNLELAADNFGNARKRDAGDRTLSVGLSQLIERGGKRDARLRQAEAVRESAARDLEALRTRLSGSVRIAFYDLLAAQARADLANDAMQLATQVAETVARRVRAGRVSPVEELKAGLALSGARIEREQAARETAALRQRLAALWGDLTPGFSRADGDLDALPTLPAIAVLIDRARASPLLARWDSEADRRRAALEIERAKAVPDVTLSAGVTRFNLFDDHALMVGVSIPLPVFDRNSGAILEAHRRLDKSADERRGEEIRLITELAEARQRAEAARSEVATLRAEILPGAQTAFNAAQRGYELGRFGILDVFDAQRTLIDNRLRHLRALAEFHRNTGEIERLTGALPATSAIKETK